MYILNKCIIHIDKYIGDANLFATRQLRSKDCALITCIVQLFAGFCSLNKGWPWRARGRTPRRRTTRYTTGYKVDVSSCCSTNKLLQPCIRSGRDYGTPCKTTQSRGMRFGKFSKTFILLISDFTISTTIILLSYFFLIHSNQSFSKYFQFIQLWFTFF